MCCDPGTVNTKMLEAGWGMYGVDVSAANDETLLALAPSLDNGSYFVGRMARKANAEAYDPKSRARLWQYLEEVTGFAY